MKNEEFRSINVDQHTHYDIGVYAKTKRMKMWEAMKVAWDQFRISQLNPLPTDLTPQEHAMVAGLLNFIRSSDADEIRLRKALQGFLDMLQERA